MTNPRLAGAQLLAMCRCGHMAGVHAFGDGACGLAGCGCLRFAAPRHRRATVPDLRSRPLGPLDPPGARRGDPATSFDAAVRAEQTAKEQRLMILGTVRGQRRHGANASECDELNGWPAGTSGRRLGEMARAPVPEIARAPDLERPTASGCWGEVFVAVEHDGQPCECGACAEGRAHVRAARERALRILATKRGSHAATVRVALRDAARP